MPVYTRSSIIQRWDSPPSPPRTASNFRLHDILGLSVSPKYQTNLCFGFRQRRLFRVCLDFPSVQVSLIFKLRGKATLNTSFFSGFQLRGSSCFRLPFDFRVSPPPSHIKCSDSSSVAFSAVLSGAFRHTSLGFRLLHAAHRPAIAAQTPLRNRVLIWRCLLLLLAAVVGLWLSAWLLENCRAEPNVGSFSSLFCFASVPKGRAGLLPVPALPQTD